MNSVLPSVNEMIEQRVNNNSTPPRTNSNNTHQIICNSPMVTNRHNSNELPPFPQHVNEKSKSPSKISLNDPSHSLMQIKDADKERSMDNQQNNMNNNNNSFSSLTHQQNYSRQMSSLPSQLPLPVQVPLMYHTHSVHRRSSVPPPNGLPPYLHPQIQSHQSIPSETHPSIHPHPIFQPHFSQHHYIYPHPHHASSSPYYGYDNNMHPMIHLSGNNNPSKYNNNSTNESNGTNGNSRHNDNKDRNLNGDSNRNHNASYAPVAVPLQNMNNAPNNNNGNRNDNNMAHHHMVSSHFSQTPNFLYHPYQHYQANGRTNNRSVSCHTGSPVPDSSFGGQRDQSLQNATCYQFVKENVNLSRDCNTNENCNMKSDDGYSPIAESGNSPSNASDESNESNGSNKNIRKRWTKEEHDFFLEGLLKYGRKWKKIQAHVKTKTAVQVRTHAYGYFSKLLRNMPETESVWEIAQTISSLPTSVIKGPRSGNSVIKKNKNKKDKSNIEDSVLRDNETDEKGMELLRRYVFNHRNNNANSNGNANTNVKKNKKKKDTECSDLSNLTKADTNNNNNHMMSDEKRKAKNIVEITGADGDDSNSDHNDISNVAASVTLCVETPESREKLSEI